MTELQRICALPAEEVAEYIMHVADNGWPCTFCSCAFGSKKCENTMLNGSCEKAIVEFLNSEV